MPVPDRFHIPPGVADVADGYRSAGFIASPALGDPESDGLWTAWQEKGRGHAAALDERLRWCLGMIGIGLVGWAMWGLR